VATPYYQYKGETPPAGESTLAYRAWWRAEQGQE